MCIRDSPLTFLISDVLSELYGRKTTTKIIWLGFISNLLMVGILFLVGIIPEQPIGMIKIPITKY